MPIELYWGRSGWVPCTLPKTSKRADFDSLLNRGVVEVRLGQLVRLGQ